jgi:hypothetical protein
VIVEAPVPTAVARPAASIVTRDGKDEVHATDDVRFCVVPSVNEPVAVNCCLRPFGTVGLKGVTAMLTRAAADTVKVDVPVTLPEDAVITVGPTCALVASPPELMLATVPLEDDQPTELVMSSVLPFV